MNEIDEKDQAVSTDASDEVSENEIVETASEDESGDTTEMASIEEHAATDSKESQGVIILFFLIGFIASLAIGWGLFPKLLYSKKDQPFIFNHALHMDEVDDGCNSCHFFYDDGTFSGIPTNSLCMECHEDIIGEDPNEIIFVEEYLDMDVEVPWLVYAEQPDCVFFSHAAHVKMGHLSCDTCHESRGDMTDMPVYEENRITGYSRDIWGKSMAGFKHDIKDRMKMDDCAACHERDRPRATSVQTGKDACFVCHK